MSTRRRPRVHLSTAADGHGALAVLCDGSLELRDHGAHRGACLTMQSRHQGSNARTSIHVWGTSGGSRKGCLTHTVATTRPCASHRIPPMVGRTHCIAKRCQCRTHCIAKRCRHWHLFCNTAGPAPHREALAHRLSHPLHAQRGHTRERTCKLELLLKLLVAGTGLGRSPEHGEVEKRELVYRICQHPSHAGEAVMQTDGPRG